MKRLFQLTFVLTLITFLMYCQFRNSPNTRQNNQPVVKDVLVNPTNPLVSDSVTFNAIAIDPDGEPITINWKVSAGVLENDGRGNPIKYEPPHDSGYVSISCIASDGRATSSLTKSIYVKMAPAVIVGFVSDARSHNMVTDAFVALDDQNTRTTSSGFFRFRSMPQSGPQLLSISKEGYKLYTDAVHFRPGMNTVNIALEKIPGTVYGIVRDAESETVLENVRVALRGMEDTTSFSGYFEFQNVPPGTHTLIAKKTGYYTYRKTIKVGPGENQVDLDL